jgi:hypothetical protein
MKLFKRDVIVNIHTFSCKVPFLLSGFNETRIFGQFFEKYRKSYFMKIRPLVAELFQVAWRADRHVTKLTAFFLCELA